LPDDVPEYTRVIAMLMPTVSIVIPVKNEERYIVDCLQAVAGQTYPAELVRVIVVDNGSTDSTRELVGSFVNGDRLQLVVMEEGTIAAVRNFGAAHAAGGIIAFLDGDCVPAPDWLETGVGLLLQNKHVACIGFVGAPPAADSTWVEKTWHHLCSTGRTKGTVAAAWLSSFNLVMWRDCYQLVSGFDATLATAEDADFGYRLSRHAGLLLSDQTMVRHLDEPKTLLEFFRKELWRGKSGLRNFIRSTHKKRDLLSVAVPIAYLFILIACVISAPFILVSRSPLLTSIGLNSLVLVVLIPVLSVMYKVRCLLTLRQSLMAVCLSMVYLFARGLVILHPDR